MRPTCRLFSFSATTDGGLIVGSGGYPGNSSRAVLLTPVGHDSTPPVITPSVTGTLSLTGSYLSNVSVSWDVRDNESPVTTMTGCQSASVTSDTAGVTFTCTATSAGGTSSGSVTIRRDTTSPQLALPADITVEATGPSGATVTYAASASDNLDSSPVLGCSPASGSVFPLGTTVVTCTALDDADNPSLGSFRVTMVDTTPPLLVVSGNLSVDAVSPTGAPVSYLAPAASDLVDTTRLPSSQLSTTERAELIADAARIKAVLGCR